MSEPGSHAPGPKGTPAVPHERRVFFFGDPLPRPPSEMKDVLGGKGASLAAMSSAGLPVPPGFTISMACCAYFHAHGGEWPPGLEAEVRTNLARLEAATGRRFGRGGRPLLVSVRSGAAVSMPGMMDTILNCGIHPGLAAEVGGGRAFWRVLVEFVLSFAKTVEGVEPRAFEGLVPPEKVTSRAEAEAYLARFRQRAGRAMPTEPWPLLVACIDAVFRSWNNARAVAYRKRNGLSGAYPQGPCQGTSGLRGTRAAHGGPSGGLQGTAVNVQAMFPSQVSGILFTRDPTDPTSDRMVIESSYGLGESVVSGAVTPDRFVVSRETLAVKEAALGRKACVVHTLEDTAECDPSAPSLTEAQVRELAELAFRVEAHFGEPVDIEWAFNGSLRTNQGAGRSAPPRDGPRGYGPSTGRFVLLQSRAIRGLEVAEDVEEGRQEEVLRLRRIAGDERRVWVAHNLGETLRAPTPLTWDLTRHFMSGAGGFGRMYRDFGYRPSERACREGFLELICGRIYADPVRQAEMFWEGMPLAYDLDAVAEDPRVLDAAPTTFDPEKADGRFLLRLPGTIVALVQASGRMKRAKREARCRFDEEVLPAFLAYVEEARTTDLRSLSTEALVAEIESRRHRVLDEFGKESLKPGYFGGMALAAVRDTLAQLAGEAEAARWAADLASGLEGDVTFEQDALLYRVATGEATMDEFLDRFGHRAVGEMELAEPRWREDPSYLTGLVAHLAAGVGRSPHEVHRTNVSRRRRAEAALPAALAEWGGSSLREDVQADLATAQALLPYRETGKHYLMMGYELLRRAMQELGRRAGLGRDVFFLRYEELAELADGSVDLRERIAPRKVRWQSAQRLTVPEVVDSGDLSRLGLAEEVESGDTLRGQAVASGVATGPARIVHDPREAGDLGTGYILVCPSTDPGWTTLFLEAGGLVVERGGVLSHGAIVARDFGIPAVVCPGATRRLPDGASVRVDGNTGQVTLLAE